MDASNLGAELSILPVIRSREASLIPMHILAPRIQTWGAFLIHFGTHHFTSVYLLVVNYFLSMSAEQAPKSANKVLRVQTLKILLDLRMLLAEYAPKITAPEQRRAYARLCTAIVNEAEEDLMSLFADCESESESGDCNYKDCETENESEQCDEEAPQEHTLSAHQEALLESFTCNLA